MIEYFQILDKIKLLLLRGKSASFGDLNFSFSDSYIEKLAALFDSKYCLQLFAKDSENGEIVGYVAAAENLEKDYITIVELFVEPTYQGKGIGLVLANNIIEFGKKKKSDTTVRDGGLISRAPSNGVDLLYHLELIVNYSAIC
ncbi:MAG: hypothetical protein UR83_C0017G0006 [Candidatus Moranbacteria bacterium GW2011_GWF2_35_54]|nr:MAG: hypothetical protein UR83_C0017G0006 [Candidatus Moranbacteria bacterium GW2011_GWF2_35_54]HBX49538.1 hypothetical protein [Bacteroidales bacterium]